jgi:hypothetical protein
VIFHLPLESIKRLHVELVFGQSTVVERSPEDDPHRFRYTVTVPGAPHACTLEISTPSNAPGLGGDVTRITISATVDARETLRNRIRWVTVRG